MTQYESDTVDKAQMMKRLMADPLFKTLILEDYIKNQAIDQGTSFTDDSVDTLKAISHLNSHIQAVLMDGDMALQNNKDK